MGEQWMSGVTWTRFAAVLYLSIGATVVAYVLFFRLLDRHPAIEVTLLTYLVPIVAALMGWVLFGEHVTLQTAAGFLVVLVGFGVMKRRELQSEVDRVRDGFECRSQK